MSDGASSLIDPSLLEGLTEEHRQEALAAAAAAKRAEERAEQRALERAMRQKQEERARLFPSNKDKNDNLSAEGASGAMSKAATTSDKIVFVSKRKRQTQQQQAQDTVAPSAVPATIVPAPKTTPSPAAHANLRKDPPRHQQQHGRKPASISWSEKERKAIQETYLGKSSTAEPDDKIKKDKKRSKKTNKKITFRFEWDNTDDTLDDADPLYAKLSIPNNHHGDRKRRPVKKSKLMDDTNGRQGYESFKTKPIEKMTPRDWRIFRENYEIVVKGGRAPPPLRSFRERPSPLLPGLNPALIDAIENVMHYKEPTPIQRQAIPIGLQRRDLIGIAETGSGKTAAFGVPLLHYIMQLPPKILGCVADDGPLALVVAPTRELALQIHGEFQKLLSRQNKIKTTCCIGGQPIQQQAQELRQGVHVVVGTPGRMNDCIEMAYLVLNQCCYIVLDEADRMVDMGFAPQIEGILDSMGGLLKSENETEAYRQEEDDLKDLENGGALPRHRLTAMFSATMPLEVERIAKRYLRHPAVISIGDQDSSKNARIVQRVVFVAGPNKKESALRQLLLEPRFLREKIIVFVNEKKHADGVGRMVERAGRACVVLHGGKSQDQREENLAAFRKGGVVLVATDVAGRGLDIPNVAHIINFDLPTRSIDTYSHRIGRTGRAGKEGLATSLMTDEDEGIMAALKGYLEATGNPVPEKLARHPAANANAQNNVIH